VSLVELSSQEIDRESLDERVIARPIGPMPLDLFLGKAREELAQRREPPVSLSVNP
jgi:hypothetical protein